MFLRAKRPRPARPGRLIAALAAVAPLTAELFEPSAPGGDMVTQTKAPEQAIGELLDRAWRVAETVTDPEMPMLTLADRGVLREISLDGGRLTVSLTPTYSGCPATHVMRREVHNRLAAAGFADVAVRTVLSPPWSADLISADGRRKLSVMFADEIAELKDRFPARLQLAHVLSGEPQEVELFSGRLDAPRLRRLLPALCGLVTGASCWTDGRLR